MSDSKFGTPWIGENRGPLNYLDGLIAPFVILSASGDVVGFFFEAEYAARARDSVNACEGIHPTVLTSWNMQGEKIRRLLDDSQQTVIELQKQRNELLDALRAFLRAPSVGSAGPGSVTIAVQDFNLRAARAAIAKVTGCKK